GGAPPIAAETSMSVKSVQRRADLTAWDCPRVFVEVPASRCEALAQLSPADWPFRPVALLRFSLTGFLSYVEVI
ncbi:MAG: hypothetical protein ABIY48_05200, partial [Acidimicrobiales bacterium]